MAINPLTGFDDGQPAPQGTPGMTLQMVQPPAEVDRSEHVGPSTVTKSVTASPETLAAMQAEQTAVAAKVAASDREFEAKKPVLEAQASGDEAAAKSAIYYQAHRERIAAEHQQKVDAEVAKAGQKRKEMEAAAHPTTFWEDRGKLAQIVSAFLTSLGDFAAMRGGTGINPAAAALREAQAEDRQRKLDKFERSKEFVELARQDVATAEVVKQRRMKEIDDEEIVQGKIIEKQIGALTKRLGIPAAQAAHDQFKAQVQQDAAEKAVKERQHYDGEITRNSGHTTSSHTTNTGANQPKSGGVDLTVLDATGKGIGLARSPKEALELRDKRTALETGNTIAEKLKTEITGNGKLWPVIQADKQSIRATYISQMLGAKKAITGAVNEQDEKRAQAKFDTAWNRGPEAVSKSIDAWKSELTNDYTAAVRSSAVTDGSPAVPGASAPAPRAAAAPAGSRPNRQQVMSDADVLRAELKKAPMGPRADAIKNALRNMAGTYAGQD